MEIKELVNNAVRSIRKERILGDIILKEYEENIEVEKEHMNLFKNIKNDTNQTVRELLKKYKIKTITDYLKTKIDFEDEKTFDYLTLLLFVQKTDVDNKTNLMFGFDVNVKGDSFIEEHYKYKFLVYMWYLNNELPTDELKKSLHKYMALDLIQSDTMRHFYSGEYESSQTVSNPDINFGIMANDIALDAYYQKLNKLVSDTNSFEMYDGLLDEESFQSKKEMYMIEFVALCSQMMDRNIVFPTGETEISDFTRKVLERSSRVNDRFNSNRRKTNNKTIYL